MLPVKKQQPTVISLGVDDVIPATPIDDDSVPTDVLKDTLKSISQFNRSSSMRGITDDIALRKKVAKFEDKISGVLANIKRLNIENDDQLQTLFVFVCQSASDYLYLKDEAKCLQVRTDLCVKLLKPFVKDDDKLCRSVIAIVQHRIKKSTWYRRNRQFLVKAGLFFLNMLGKAI